MPQRGPVGRVPLPALLFVLGGEGKVKVEVVTAPSCMLATAHCFPQRWEMLVSWGFRCAPGLSGDGKNSGLLGQASSLVAVEHHLVDSHSGA